MFSENIYQYFESILLKALDQVFGIIIGTLITIFIVDRLVKWREAKRWERSKIFIYDNISYRIFMVISQFCMAFNMTPRVFSYIALDMHLGKGKVSLVTIKTFKELIEALKIDLSLKTLSVSVDQVMDFHRRVQPELLTISQNLIPRTLEFSLRFGKDHLLIEKLHTFENISSNFQSGIVELSDDYNVITSRFKEIILLLDGCHLILSGIFDLNLKTDPLSSPLDELNQKKIIEMSKIHTCFKIFYEQYNKFLKVETIELSDYKDFRNDVIRCRDLVYEIKRHINNSNGFQVYLKEKMLLSILKASSSKFNLINILLEVEWSSFIKKLNELSDYSFKIKEKELLNFVISLNNSLNFRTQLFIQKEEALSEILRSISEWKNIDANVRLPIQILVEELASKCKIYETIIKDCQIINQQINVRFREYLPTPKIDL